MLRTHDERYARLTEWIAQRKRADYRFNVKPRYTAGSPAMVDEGTAHRVAESELQSFEYASDERCGAETAEKARRLGLGGIVTAMREQPRGKGWDVLDLITGERTLKAFDKRTS
jgi:hypothetical protein